MGKAARRRKAHRRKYLSEMSYANPERFKRAWEIRVSSWMSEIKRLSRARAEGDEDADRCVVEIVAEAENILSQCDPSVVREFGAGDVGMLLHESAGRNYLSELSYADPERFKRAWEIRVSSWMSEIERLSRAWAEGDEDADRCVFEIVAEAENILSRCKPSVVRKFGAEDVGMLLHESAARVANLVDRRLYRLSNMSSLEYRAPLRARA